MQGILPSYKAKNFSDLALLAMQHYRRAFQNTVLPSFPLILAWNSISGLAISPANPLGDTVLQERTSPKVRAHVFGTFNSVIFGAVPLGPL
jgi:MFS family permease